VSSHRTRTRSISFPAPEESWLLVRIAALDAKTAINQWIEKYQITDVDQQKRLAARRVNDD
jgi:hypothetical protein